MDLRVYYQKIRDYEAAIPDAYAVVVSLPTGDGGKEGVISEVTRRVAAKMLAEGSALLATAAQVKTYQEQNAIAAKAAQEAAAAGRVEVTVVTSDDLRKLRSGSKSAKE